MSKKRSYSIYSDEQSEDYMLLMISQHENQIQTLIENLRTDYPYLYTIDDSNDVPFIQYTNPDRQKSLDFYQNNIILQSGVKKTKDLVDQTGWVWIEETKSTEDTTIDMTNKPSVDEKLINASIVYTFKFNGTFVNQLSLVTNPNQFFYSTNTNTPQGEKHFTESSWRFSNLVKYKDTDVNGRAFIVGRTVMQQKEFYKLFFKIYMKVATKLLTESKVEYYKDIVINSMNFKNITTKGSYGIDGLSKRGAQETVTKSLNYLLIKNVKIACYRSVQGTTASNLTFANPIQWVDKLGNTVSQFVIPEVKIPLQIAGSNWIPYSLRTYPPSQSAYHVCANEATLQSFLMPGLPQVPDGSGIIITQNINLLNVQTVLRSITIEGATPDIKISMLGSETTFEIAASNVRFRNIILENLHQSSTAKVLNFTNSTASCYIDNCTISTNECGVNVDCHEIQITNSKFLFAGTPDSNRYIVLNRTNGHSIIHNNVFQGNGQNTTQCVFMTGQTANYIGGALTISCCNNDGYASVQRLFMNEGVSLAGTSMKFNFIKNRFTCASGFAIFYNNDAFNGVEYIVATENEEILAANQTTAGSKGIIGVDTVTTGTIYNTKVFAANNIIPALRPDYLSLTTDVFNGVVTSATELTLVDATQNWEPHNFRDDVFATCVVEILSGTGAGQTRTIGGNSNNTLYVTQSWNTLPAASSVYRITYASNAFAYASSKFNPNFKLDIKNNIKPISMNPYYWNPKFKTTETDILYTGTSDIPFPIGIDTPLLKFTRNKNAKGYNVYDGSAIFVSSITEPNVAFDVYNVLGFTPKIYLEQSNDASIILVQNVSHSLDNYFVNPLVVGDSLELNSDLVRLFINQNHLPGQVLNQCTRYFGGDQYWYWEMPFFDILEFEFDNQFEHDIRDRLMPDTISNPIDYYPVKTRDLMFIPNFELSCSFKTDVTYKYFRPKAGYVSKTHTTLRTEDLEERFTKIENALTALKSDVKTAQSQITQLAQFSSQLYTAVVENYNQLFNVVKNTNNIKDRNYNVVVGAKGTFVKVFQLIPVIGQYSSFVDQGLDLLISTATEIGKAEIVDEVLTMKDAALAMAAIDTALIGNILSKNYVIDEEDKKKLAKNTLSHLDEMQYKFRLMQQFEHLYPQFIVNKCTYYLRKISQFKAVGALLWKYARLKYTNSDAQQSNYVPGHAFLEIILTKVGKVNNNYTMKQHIYIVSTGDFNGLGLNIALLTILRNTQQKSLFNYTHLTKTFNFTEQKYEWDTPQMQNDYATFWNGLKEEESNNTQEDEHYAVLTTEVNIQPDAMEFFLNQYKITAPAYNILGFNCQVQAKEVMNFIVQGIIPSWWSDTNNINYAVALVNSPDRAQYYDQSFKDKIANPQSRPPDPGL